MNSRNMRSDASNGTHRLVTLFATLLWLSGGARGYIAYRTAVVATAFLAEL